MQVSRVRVFLAFGVICALAGCKPAEVVSSKSCPAPAPPGIALNVYIDDGHGHDKDGWEVHSAGAAPSGQITWTTTTAPNFTVTFSGANSPCNDIKTTSTSPYTVTCTLKNPSSGTSHPYPYQIGLAGPPATDGHKLPKQKFPAPPGGNDHCEGCVVDN
jgi:hypothetical protein